MISVFGGEIHVPIGEQIGYSGLILEAYKTESHDCEGCYFRLFTDFDLSFSCSSRANS